MLRKILKISGWSVAGIVALVVVLYLVVLAINWRDAQPSADAVRLAELYRNRPAVPDERNAFVYVMGFDVPQGEDPRAMGTKRIAWMNEAIRTSSWDSSPDPLGESGYRRDGRSPRIKDLVDSCTAGRVGCAAAFLAGEQVLDEWMASERWVFERYRHLLAHGGWWESVSFDLDAPLPAYGFVVDGQRLLLLQARALAQQGDAAGVRELLEGDLRFWRMVLESSDILISKMVATGALNRHFELGNLVLREMQPGAAASAMPAGWRAEISDAERSMFRCMTGEWMWISVLAADTRLGYDEQEHGLLSRSTRALVLPLYQPQDTTNKYAEHYLHTAESLVVPLDRYDDAVEELTREADHTLQTMFESRSPYNIVGALILATAGGPDFSSYARRLGDIEGVRRAALLAVMLRDANVKAADVAAALQAAELRSPYDEQPFVWDEQHGAIVFNGLQLDERGTHRIYY